jgi:hypothetical protein
MLADDLISLFIIPLNRAGIDHVVTGSVASMLYGEPRMTHDIDLVVDVASEQIGPLLASFPEENYYRPPAEVVSVEISRGQRGHFNLIHHSSGFKADIYLCGSDPLQRWALEHRRIIPVNGIDVRIAPPEYVIIRKLEYYRESGYQKHILDIEGMLRINAETISLPIISEWVQIFGLSKEWATITRT